MIEPLLYHIAVQRTARYYQLGESDAADRWLVCHGYGQLAATFISYFGPIAEPGRLVLAPEGLSRFYNSNGAGPPGASWMTREDREEEIRDYLRYLDAVLDAVGPGPDGARLRVLGFSQGAATAGRWAIAARALPAEVVFWGAGPPPEWFEPGAGERVAGMRVLLVTGERDHYTSPAAQEATCERLRQGGIPADVIVFPGAHRLDRTVLGRIARGEI